MFQCYDVKVISEEGMLHCSTVTHEYPFSSFHTATVRAKLELVYAVILLFLPFATFYLFVNTGDMHMAFTSYNTRVIKIGTSQNSRAAEGITICARTRF